MIQLNSSIVDNLGTALGVYVGLLLGFTLQEADSAGRATVALQVANATSLVPTWVDQTYTSAQWIPILGLLLAFFFMSFLLIARIPSTTPTVFLTHVFPLLISASW